MNAYYIKHSDAILPIFGVTSLEEARQFVEPKNHARIVETPDDVMMNPATGSVDFRSNWEAEGHDEAAGLIVVRYDAETESWVEA